MSHSHGNSSSRPALSHERAIELVRPLIEDHGVQQLIRILGEKSGLCLVGGSIRELLSSAAETDIDLAVRFLPLEVKALLEKHRIKVVETGIDHGTVLAVIDGKHYEITTYRQPGPRIGSGFSDSIETDLGGRDFTINAIAFDLITAQLVDPFDGIADLEKGMIRCVGNARERLEEDPLRILRVVRFGAAAGRSIDPDTEAAAIVLRESLREVSVERIRNELEAILMSTNASEGFRALVRMNLLELTIPEMIQTIGVEQNEFHVDDVFEHTLAVVSQAPRDRILRLTALFHDLGKPATVSVDEQGRRHFYLHEQVSAEICRQVMRRLRYSHSETEVVALLVETHMRPLTCGPQGVRRLIRDLGEHLDRWFKFKFADKPPRGKPGEFEAGVDNFTQLLEAEQNRSVGSVYSALAVRGDDVMALGIKEGPRVGEILKALHEEVIEEPERNTRQYLLSRIPQLATKP